MLTDLRSILALAEEKGLARSRQFNCYTLQECVHGCFWKPRRKPAHRSSSRCSAVWPIPTTAISSRPPFLEAIRQLPQPRSCTLTTARASRRLSGPIRLGMTGVMIDASTLPLEENIAMTKLAAELCSYAGVPVEGELGHVGATKDEVLGNYTDVAEAERFVKETGVSALAVMVGTAHGRYKKAPVLDIQRIRDIREATGKLPLVLHGGSGVPDEQIRMAVEAGIRKVNFATDLCYAFLDQVMVTERTTVALDVFMREPIHAVRDYCIGKIKLLGADKIL